MLLSFFIGSRKDNIDVCITSIGNENFVAVDDPLIAIENRSGPGATSIGTCRGFSQSKSTKQSALGQRDQILLFLLLGTEQIDWIGAE